MYFLFLKRRHVLELGYIVSGQPSPDLTLPGASEAAAGPPQVPSPAAVALCAAGQSPGGVAAAAFISAGDGRNRLRPPPVPSTSSTATAGKRWPGVACRGCVSAGFDGGSPIWAQMGLGGLVCPPSIFPVAAVFYWASPAS
jgi:hypothetical protein